MYRFLFPVCLFLSASLLFIIQPMVAKVLLPIYGGTPAVWTVCMLFFQLLLLIAYSYAWVLSRLRGVHRWRVVHLCVCLFSLCVLPLALIPSGGDGIPEIEILGCLLLQLGLPLMVVGASAPLLQYAFSQTRGTRAADRAGAGSRGSAIAGAPGSLRARPGRKNKKGAGFPAPSEIRSSDENQRLSVFLASCI